MDTGENWRDKSLDRGCTVAFAEMQNAAVGIFVTQGGIVQRNYGYDLVLCWRNALGEQMIST